MALGATSPGLEVILSTEETGLALVRVLFACLFLFMHKCVELLTTSGEKEMAWGNSL